MLRLSALCLCLPALVGCASNLASYTRMAVHTPSGRACERVPDGYNAREGIFDPKLAFGPAHVIYVRPPDPSYLVQAEGQIYRCPRDL